MNKFDQQTRVRMSWVLFYLGNMKGGVWHRYLPQKYYQQLLPQPLNLLSASH